MKKAVVILSGGMDSATSLFIAKKEGYEIIPLHFNYAQRTEKKELECFNNICEFLNLKNRYIIDIPFFKQIGASALVDENIEVPFYPLPQRLQKKKRPRQYISEWLKKTAVDIPIAGKNL